MRRIAQPGPVHPARVQCVEAAVQYTDIVLPPGSPLLQGVAEAAQAQGAASAVLSLQSGSLNPLAFVMPATSQTPEHVAYFSERHAAQGQAQIESGCITYGHRDGQPWLHCHAIWRESDGVRRSGHLLPNDCRVAEPVHLRAWLLDGAAFEVQPDAETNFSLFQVSKGVACGNGADALVARIHPNEDLCLALETLCAEHGVRQGRICAGVGSLIGTIFDDGRVVESSLTEVFIREGMIGPTADGAPRCRVDVGLVDNLGHMDSGTLARGRNAVLITFEVVIQVLQRQSLECL